MDSPIQGQQLGKVTFEILFKFQRNTPKWDSYSMLHEWLVSVQSQVGGIHC